LNHCNFNYKLIVMSKTILIVEDFEDTRKLLKFVLEDLGYDTLEATDGWSAVEIVKKQAPDLILMDLALPMINGLSATRLLRGMEETAETPIIALTASGEYLHDPALEAGCDDFVTKPLDVDKLRPLLERHLPN
jgi:CheY-like chemotaxis protein